jgi:hypothetical protein
VDREKYIADSGDDVKFAASSTQFGSMGGAHAKCEIYGVGYIREGRRGFITELVAAHGTLGVTARGPLVPGFSGL